MPQCSSPHRPISWFLAMAWLGLVVMASLFITRYGDPLRLDLSTRLVPPSSGHWLGTDELGRDVLTRLCFAARFTLFVTVVATTLALGLGFILGCSAAWFGGRWDALINALINLFWTVPFVVFAVLIIAIVGATPLALVLAIGGVNWVSSARVFRSEMLQLRQRDFMVAARAQGFHPAHIFFAQAMPNLRAAGLTLLGYSSAETLTLESGLAFLGLSLAPPAPTWGGMLAQGLAYFSTGWWLAAMPAITVTLTLVSLRVLADGLGTGERKS